MDSEETAIFNTILISVVLFGAIICVFVTTLMRHHRKKLQLQKEKTTIEINTLESERSRIARDMHDDISPLLSTVLLKLDTLGRMTQRQKESIEKMKFLLHDIFRKVNETSNDLLPPLIANKGIIYAIRDFIENVGDNKIITIHADLPVEDVLPPDKSHIHIYRIVKEVFHNCIKHSSAKNFSISAKWSPNEIRILMEDDGIGYDAQKVFKDGKGLTNIVNRVELLNGSLYVDTSPGRGVSYQINLPLK